MMKMARTKAEHGTFFVLVRDFGFGRKNRTGYGASGIACIVKKQIVKWAISVSSEPIRCLRTDTVRYGPPIGTVSPNQRIGGGSYGG